MTNRNEELVRQAYQAYAAGMPPASWTSCWW